MIKNVKIRVLALIIASVMLGGALMVAAIMGSPYETLKNAVLDALTYRNVTIDSKFTININGEVYEESKSYYINGDNSALSCYFDNDGNLVTFNYTSKNFTIYPNTTEVNGEQWYSAQLISSYNNNYIAIDTGVIGGIMTPEDRDSAMMRFVEMVVDALVGNLKNNITMSTGGDIRYIQGTLTESQVPEIIKAGIDVLIEQSNNYPGPVTREDFDGSNPFAIPMESLTINYLHGEAEVDADGNLLSFYINATATIVNIFGETDVLELSGNVSFTDIGTSSAVCPIPGAEELLTPAYITSNFGNNYNHGIVYFTLNEDGSIDANSVTTTYPGQWDRDKYFDIIDYDKYIIEYHEYIDHED